MGGILNLPRLEALESAFLFIGYEYSYYFKNNKRGKKTTHASRMLLL